MYDMEGKSCGCFDLQYNQGKSGVEKKQIDPEEEKGMTEHRNRYIYTDMRLFRSKRVRRIALGAALIALMILAAVLVPGIGKYGKAREFVEALYETTEADVKDPTGRVERIRELATEELAEELMQRGGIPAVALQERNAKVETWFEHGTLTQEMFPEDEYWTDELAGSVRIHDHTNELLLNGWQGAVYVRVEKVEGK